MKTSEMVRLVRYEFGCANKASAPAWLLVCVGKLFQRYENARNAKLHDLANFHICSAHDVLLAWKFRERLEAQIGSIPKALSYTPKLQATP